MVGRVDGSWVHFFEGSAHISEMGGILQARRILPSMPAKAMVFFRPQDNPLIQEDPPLDVRQSVLLEALMRSSHNPSQHYELARTYAHALLQPRTKAARAHDTEISLVELRALGIDQQLVIDLLLEANNNLQQRHAQTGLELIDLTRRVKQQQKERAEMLQQFHQWRRRQEVRNEALLEQIDSLNRRLRNVEHFS